VDPPRLAKEGLPINLTFCGPVHDASGYAEMNRSLLAELYRPGLNIKLQPPGNRGG